MRKAQEKDLVEGFQCIQNKFRVSNAKHETKLWEKRKLLEMTFFSLHTNLGVGKHHIFSNKIWRTLIDAALYSFSPKIYSLSHRMFRHMQKVNISIDYNYFLRQIF